MAERALRPNPSALPHRRFVIGRDAPKLKVDRLETLSDTCVP
jgi:hypothetical protein